MVYLTNVFNIGMLPQKKKMSFSLTPVNVKEVAKASFKSLINDPFDAMCLKDILQKTVPVCDNDNAIKLRKDDVMYVAVTGKYDSKTFSFMRINLI